MADGNEDQQEAWRAALSISALAMIGFSIGGVMFMLLRLAAQQSFIASALSAIVFAFVLFRPGMSWRQSLVSFAVATAVIGFGMWANNDVYNGPGHVSVPFSEHKLVVLVIAFLAPAMSFGAWLIAGTVLLAIAQYMSWPAEEVHFIPLFEPWQTILIGIAALFVLSARRREVRVMRELARAHADAIWLERVARLMLAVRDLANTPLQTLSLGAELVRAQCAALAGPVERLGGAIGRLAHLSRVLAPVAGVVPSKVTGFDALDDLEREIAESLGGRAGMHGSPVSLDALDPRQEASRAALWFSWVIATVALVFVLLAEWRQLPAWATLLVVGVGLGGIGLHLARPNLPRIASLAIISVQSVVVLFAVWIAADIQARSGLTFAPYGGLKIGMLAMMLLMPSVLLGFVLLTAGVLLPMIQTGLWSPAIHARMPEVEPALTVALGLVMMVALGIRRRHVMMMRVAAAGVSETTWFERVARLTLLIRELSSESIEVVQVETTRMLDEPDAPHAMTLRMDNAARRLARMSDLLAPLGPYLPTRFGDRDASRDAIDAEVNALIADVTDRSEASHGSP